MRNKMHGEPSSSCRRPVSRAIIYARRHRGGGPGADDFSAELWPRCACAPAVPIYIHVIIHFIYYNTRTAACYDWRRRRWGRGRCSFSFFLFFFFPPRSFFTYLYFSSSSSSSSEGVSYAKTDVPVQLASPCILYYYVYCIRAACTGSGEEIATGIIIITTNVRPSMVKK